MSEMMDRVRNAIMEKFAPAIDFRAPYAKVMLDATAEAILAVQVASQADVVDAERVAIKNRIDTRLNDILVDMEPGFDDSIEGFNKAWDAVRELFDNPSEPVT